MAIELKNDLDRFSYGLAMNIVASVKQIPIEINENIVAETITDLLAGGQPTLQPEEYRRVMQEFQAKLQEASQKQAEEAGKANIEAEKQFLAENAKKDGIIMTMSGLQYQVLQEGSGDSPKATDIVTVHYEGKLLSGQVFDSSYKRGEPTEFPINQVIPGWTEALQLMKRGSKYRLFIPSSLAYGAHGAGEVIAPHSTLIFDVELLDFKSK